MKRTSRIAGLLVLAIGAAVLGLSQFMSLEERSHTTDVVKGAVAVVAGAANRMTSDDKVYVVEVATPMGRGRLDERDEPMAVMATIAVRGGYGLSEVCTSMPRVRDAINAVTADRIRPRLSEGRRLVPDDLLADGRVVMASLNQVVRNDAVTGVRLVLKSARSAQESGCD